MKCPLLTSTLTRRWTRCWLVVYIEMIVKQFFFPVGLIILCLSMVLNLDLLVLSYVFPMMPYLPCLRPNLPPIRPYFFIVNLIFLPIYFLSVGSIFLPSFFELCKWMFFYNPLSLSFSIKLFIRRHLDFPRWDLKLFWLPYDEVDFLLWNFVHDTFFLFFAALKPSAPILGIVGQSHGRWALLNDRYNITYNI